MKTELIEKAYAIARERYAEIGVDTEKALAALQNISLSLHCWQADDVTGFENRGGDLTGGIQATGNYPGRATTPEELMADIDTVLKLCPGTKKLNLHACYAIFDDENGIMNRSILETAGEILAVSQFTLMARTKKGNRPSYIDAAKPEISVPLYEKFVQLLQKELQKEIKTGVFGADMQVGLINDGPVTIIIDSKNRL